MKLAKNLEMVKKGLIPVNEIESFAKRLSWLDETGRTVSYENRYNRGCPWYDEKWTYASVKEKYNTPSTIKIEIERDILSIMNELNGYNYRVLGGSCFAFTAFFNVELESGHEIGVTWTRDKVTITV